MIRCGHYHEEDGTCGFDDIICMDEECPYGLYETEQEDQGDMFESSTCQFFILENGITGFNCTIPEWV